MIRFPGEWVQRRGAHVTTANVPALGARFRYFARWRPPRSFSRVVDDVLASDAEFHVHDVGEMRRLVTVEREYGAWVTIAGRREGGRARRHVAAVFMDDFTAVLDVLAIVPAHFAEVERVAMQLAREQELGTSRRPRLFYYEPPRDWQSVPNGLVASWYPPDFPNNLTTIIVPPAMPDDGSAEASIEAALAGEVESASRERIVTIGGLSGDLVSVTVPRPGQPSLHRELAVFQNAHYIYRLSFETARADGLGRGVFRGVVSSLHPLPSADEARAGQAFAAPLDIFDHWAS